MERLTEEDKFVIKKLIIEDLDSPVHKIDILIHQLFFEVECLEKERDYARLALSFAHRLNQSLMNELNDLNGINA